MKIGYIFLVFLLILELSWKLNASLSLSTSCMKNLNDILREEPCRRIIINAFKHIEHRLSRALFNRVCKNLFHVIKTINKNYHLPCNYNLLLMNIVRKLRTKQSVVIFSKSLVVITRLCLHYDPNLLKPILIDLNVNPNRFKFLLLQFYYQKHKNVELLSNLVRLIRILIEEEIENFEYLTTSIIEMSFRNLHINNKIPSYFIQIVRDSKKRKLNLSQIFRLAHRFFMKILTIKVSFFDDNSVFIIILNIINDSKSKYVVEKLDLLFRFIIQLLSNGYDDPVNNFVKFLESIQCKPTYELLKLA